VSWGNGVRTAVLGGSMVRMGSPVQFGGGSTKPMTSVNAGHLHVRVGSVIVQ
jgi:hypothetical protein